MDKATASGPSKGPGRRERGAAVVEFAIVLPFLAVIVLGAVDAGRAFRLQNRLVNAAREGGVFAQFHPASVDAGCDSRQSIVDRVTDEDAGLGSLPAFQVQVFKRDVTSGALTPSDGYRGCRSVSSVSLAPGDHVVVRVRATFSLLTPLVSALVGSPITMTGSQEVVVQG